MTFVSILTVSVAF